MCWVSQHVGWTSFLPIFICTSLAKTLHCGASCCLYINQLKTYQDQSSTTLKALNMDYSLLPGEKAPKTKRPSPLVIILLVAVCCLAAWNTYLTLDRGKLIFIKGISTNKKIFLSAEFDQLKDELQQGLIEEYLKNTFHALQSR